MFSEAGFDMQKIHLKRNAPVAQLYEDAIKYEGAVIAASGALINFSGKKTGRSPKDKRIVYEETSKDDVWWGAINIQMDEHTFEINRERAIDYLNTRDNVYVFDGFAGVRLLSHSLLGPEHGALTVTRSFNQCRSGTPSTASRSASLRRAPTTPSSCTTCSSALRPRSSRSLARPISPSTTRASSRPTASRRA